MGVAVSAIVRAVFGPHTRLGILIYPHSSLLEQRECLCPAYCGEPNVRFSERKIGVDVP